MGISEAQKDLESARLMRRLAELQLALAKEWLEQVNNDGKWLVDDLPPEELEQAVEAALRRDKAGKMYNITELQLTIATERVEEVAAQARQAMIEHVP